MLSPFFLVIVSWFVAFSLTAAGLVPLNSNLEIRNAPGTSSSETLLALRQALSSAALLKRDTIFNNSTSLDTSWDGAVLLNFNNAEGNTNSGASVGVKIVCTTCYIKGIATAQLTVNGKVNISQAFDNVTSQIENNVEGIIKAAFEDVVNVLEDHPVAALAHPSEINFPPLPVDFDLDIPDIPEAELRFQFDGMEIYMDIDALLSSASYTINLYTSETEIGAEIKKDGADLFLGVIFSVDLILSVEADIDISSGFHIKLNDGIVIDIHMFDKNVSSIAFNGGHFEFLPVTISTQGGIALTAALRIGIKAGVGVSTSESNAQNKPAGFGAGIQASVWADIAKFVINVTDPSASSNDCNLQVVEEYSLLVGANAGATMQIEGHSWGPVARTQTPIYYTTLGEQCAKSASPRATAIAATTPAAKLARAVFDSSTTVITYVATKCLSNGLLDCPASLQSTVMTTVTQTLPSDGETTATAQITDVSTIAFGTNTHKIDATSGAPSSYNPSQTSGFTPASTKGETGGTSNKVIVGICVGIGLPLLLTIIAISIFLHRGKAAPTVPYIEPDYSYFNQPTRHSLEPDTPMSQIPRKQTPDVSVIEHPQQH